LTEQGYYDTVLVTAFGCDSLLSLYLRVYSSDTVDIAAEICEGDNYKENGFEIMNPAAGVYNEAQYLSTVHNCDSIVRLQLTVYPVYEATEYDTICSGAGYSGHGIELNSAQTTTPGTNEYTSNLGAISGCDSIIHLQLTTHPSYEATDEVNICASALPYYYALADTTFGVGTPALSTNHFRLTTQHGCDSTVTLTLRVHPVYDEVITASICEGESYLENNFTYTTPAVGYYESTKNLTTAHGCDSTVKLELTVNRVYDTYLTDTTCEGEFYSGHGFHLANLSAGILDTVSHKNSVAGCDSTVYLELMVMPRKITDLYDTVCAGESYHGNGFTIYQGQTQTAGDKEFSRHEATSFYCDSLIKLHLRVNETYSITHIDTICKNIDYSGYGFELSASELTAGEENVRVHNYTTTRNCDSIITLRLQVLNCIILVDDNIATYNGEAVSIDVLPNDTIDDYCSTTLAPEIAIEPLHGTVSYTGTEYIYTPETGYSGVDSMLYVASCHGLTDSAWVYYHVTGLPDNVDTSDCYVTELPSCWSMQSEGESSGTYSHNSIPLTGDVDNDGKIEILATSSDGKTIYFLDATSPSLSVKYTIAVRDGSSFGNESCISLGDVDGDGYSEVFYTLSNGNVYCIGYNTVSHQYGTLRWSGSYRSYNSWYKNPQPLLGDINGDGLPELVVYDKIYNAVSGALLADGRFDLKGWNYGAGAMHVGVNSNSVSSVMSMGDVDRDGHLELVAGDMCYKIDINNPNGTAGNRIYLYSRSEARAGIVGDGATTLADIDNDGYLDVIVTRRRNATRDNPGPSSGYGTVYVWNPRSGAILHTNSITTIVLHATYGGPSVATVSDIDGDGLPEIVLVGRYTLTAYKYNPTLRTLSTLWNKSTNDLSGSSGVSAYDFDMDGQAELVYRDQTHLRILSGINGHDTASYELHSETYNEYPVISDVDGDGSAEIIVSGSRQTGGVVKLHVIGSKPSYQWSGCRSVWHQYVYNGVNVNADMSIPRQEFNQGVVMRAGAIERRPYNSCLQQLTYINSGGIAMTSTTNVSITMSGTGIEYSCDTVSLSFVINNTSDKELYGGYGYTFYKDSVGGSVISTGIFDEPLSGGTNRSVRKEFSNTYLRDYLPIDSIVVSINDKGVGAGQSGGSQPECELEDNGLILPFWGILDSYDYTIRDTLCMGSFYEGYNFTTPVFDLPQHYEEAQYLQSVYGCDSTVRLALVIVDCMELIDDYYSTYNGKVIDMSPKDNDIIDAYCQSSRPVLLQPQQHGSTQIIGSNIIRYTPEPDYVGLDSMQYSLFCGGVYYDSAWIYVRTSYLPDNVLNPECYSGASSGGLRIIEYSGSEYEKYSSKDLPLTGDVDGDGEIEILSVYRELNVTKLHLLSSSTGALSEKYSIEIPAGEHLGMSNSVLLSDADRDGYSEIYYSTEEGHVYCISYDELRGQYLSDPRWRATYLGYNSQYYNSPQLQITDFNGDGLPELVVYDRVYNAVTGALLLDGDFKSRGWTYGVGGLQRVIGNSGTIAVNMPAVGDLDGDGLPELCCGNMSYKITITNTGGVLGNSISLYKESNMREEVGDGATALCDIDLDGGLDVVVVRRSAATAGNPFGSGGTGVLYIWNPRTGAILNDNPITNIPLSSTQDGPSVPMLGDIDGDGYVEIVISSGSNIYAYDYDVPSRQLSEKWSKSVTMSGAIGVTMFDFTIDGVQELIYKDNSGVYVLNGTDGSQLYRYPLYSTTGGEYPVVADVNGDGSAEIIVVGSTNTGAANSGVYVLGSIITGQWGAARSVWHQYSYSAVSINEDMTVPSYSFNQSYVFGTGRPYNNYLCQLPMLTQNGEPFYSIADAMITSGGFEIEYLCDSVKLTITYHNIGDRPLYGGYSISLYKNNYKGTLMDIKTIDDRLDVYATSHQTYYYTPEAWAEYEPLTKIVVAVNDGGDGVGQSGGEQQECNIVNNISEQPFGGFRRTYERHYNDVVCQGSRYYRYGFLYPSDSTMNVGLLHGEQHLATSHGCDSIITLDLTVSEVYDDIEALTVCGEDIPYLWEGMYLSVNGTYRKSYHTIAGCDSIKRIFFAVEPSYYYLSDTVICGGEYLDWRGRRYRTSVEVYDSLQTTGSGCDSVYHLSLTVSPHYNITEREDICSDELPYYWHNQLLTASGYYTSVGQSIYGCDSSYNIYLTVYQTAETHLYDTICQYTTYSNYGFEYGMFNAAGNYELHKKFETTEHCDSTVHLHLHVKPTYTESIYDSICQNEVYSGYGFSLPADTTAIVGEHTSRLYLSSSNGCDSVVQLNLYVREVYDEHKYDTICQNDTYAGYGFEIGQSITQTSGDYQTSVMKLSIESCDSLTTLHLHINAEQNTTLHDTVCEGDVYENNGYSIGAILTGNAGDYTYYLNETTSAGCDSTVLLYLRVNGVAETELYDDVCRGDSYGEYGFSIPSDSTATAGIYESILSLSTAEHCDSTVTLHLTIHSEAETVFADTVCQLESYANYGFIVPGDSTQQCGLYTEIHEYETVDGCDSTVYLKLQVEPVYNYTVYDTVCAGEAYSGYNFYLSGDQTQLPGVINREVNLETLRGCDSTVKLELTVAPNFDIYQQQSVCETELPYIWHDIECSAAGIYYDENLSVSGCDSTYTLQLNVGTSTEADLPVTACSNELPYIYNGVPHYISGVYTYYYASMYGCDSVVHLYLSISHDYTVTLYDSICEGDTYYNYNFYYPIDSTNIPGTHIGVQNNISNSGCDSIVTLYLEVIPDEHVIIEDSVCQGYAYSGYGFALPSGSTQIPGTIVRQMMYNSVYGCDSLVVLHLDVKPSVYTELYGDVCRGEGYEGNGFVIPGDSTTQAGLYETSQTYTSAVSGCDSIVSLHLTVHPDYHSWITTNVCQGEGFVGYGFNVPADSLEGKTEYVESYEYESIYGCDSVRSLQLYVRESYAIYIERTICAGDGYEGEGFELSAGETSSAGYYEYEHLYQSQYNCDSLMVLQLTINPVSGVTQINVGIETNLCTGDAYADNGFNVSGEETLLPGVWEYYRTEHNVYGCDSLIMIELTIEGEPLTIGEIYGDFSGTLYDETSGGVFEYSIDSIANADYYLWELTGAPWYIEHDSSLWCTVYVRTRDDGELTVRAVNECGESSYSRTLSVYATGISEGEGSVVELYPNPSSDMVTLYMRGIEGEVDIIIRDVALKVVDVYDYEASNKESKFVYSVKGYSSGVYYVSVRSGNITVIKKMVVQR
jgi:hypothetical protein